MHKYNIFMNIFIYVNDAYEFEEASNQKNCLETNSDSIKKLKLSYSRENRLYETKLIHS